MKNTIGSCLQDLRQVINSLVDDTSGLLADAQSISEKYRVRQSGKFPKENSRFRVVSTEREALAYAAARMPATLTAVAAALSQATASFPIEPKSVLDVGAGPGTASWAACSLFPSIQSITMIEREPVMQNLGKLFIEHHPDASEALKRATFFCMDIREMPSIEADLVIASYSLGELPEADRLKACEKLFSSARQMLLLIEPGTPNSFKNMLSVRSHLLSKNAHLAGPCPHENNCPLPSPDWCHFSCRVQRDRLQKQLKGGEAPYEDEKYFYLSFVHEKIDNKETTRILRKPIIKPGNVHLKLCTYNDIQTIIVRHGNKKAFRNARKASVGDQFTINPNKL